jgi:hypothetical protein
MTNPGVPVTAAAVVFGDMAKTAAALAGAISSDQVARAVCPVLQGLPAAARATAIQEAGVVGAGLLDLDLGSLLVAGWRKYTALTQAARRTTEMPGREEIVNIATHQISVVSHPDVELLVNEVRAAMINFDLTVEFEVTALTGVIRSGRLVALGSGRCATTVSVAIEGVPVATRTAEFDLNPLIRLGNGIPLLPAPSTSAALPGRSLQTTAPQSLRPAPHRGYP